LVHLTPRADVIHDVADHLIAAFGVAAAVHHDGGRQLRVGHIMRAVADDLGVIAVRRNALDTAPRDIEVDVGVVARRQHWLMRCIV